MAKVRGQVQKRPANSSEGPFVLTGEQWLGLDATTRAKFTEKAFRYWRRKGFPYFSLSNHQQLWELDALHRIGFRDVFHGREVFGNNAAVNFASSFHPQMWSVQVSRYLSPMQVFLDDVLLRGAIERSLTVWPDRQGASAASMRKILKTFTGCAAVSNFKPTVARAIMSRFSEDGDTVIDFSAGYGGRLVGALTLPRCYVGIDPSSEQIRGLRECAKTMRRLHRSAGTAEVIKGCAEDVLPTLQARSAQLVFSSPPYHQWEKYSLEKSQSYIRYPAYEDWVKLFLGATIEQSYRVLSPGGFLAINVPNVINRLPLAYDVGRLAKETGFERYCYYRFRLSKVAFLHPRGPDSSKWEQISVFRKKV